MDLSKDLPTDGEQSGNQGMAERKWNDAEREFHARVISHAACDRLASWLPGEDGKTIGVPHMCWGRERTYMSSALVAAQIRRGCGGARKNETISSFAALSDACPAQPPGDAVTEAANCLTLRIACCVDDAVNVNCPRNSFVMSAKAIPTPR